MIASIPPLWVCWCSEVGAFFCIIYILNNYCEIVWHFQKGGLVSLSPPLAVSMSVSIFALTEKFFSSQP